jgi:alkylation response protein AidB-like acyl-CoA dehydrogenase
VIHVFKRDLFDTGHLALRHHVGAFLDEEIVPHHQGWTEREYVPPDAWQKAGSNGLLCRTVPVEYGGLGRDFRDSVIVIEELAARRLPGLLTYLQSDIVAPALLRLGSETQKLRYLPALCAGRSLGAMALTEPHSGSDIYAMQTKAERSGDGFVLNGSKTHISNGSTADLIVVAARSRQHAIGGQAGFTLLLVEATTPGLSREKISKSGMRALNTSCLRFDNCPVGADGLLGPEGLGFLHLMTFLVVERLVLSVYAQASGEALLRELIGACHDRRTSMGTVLGYQNTQFRLADLFSECATNRAFVDLCIAQHLAGRLDPRAACIAKLRTTELLKTIAALGFQLRGASGISGVEGTRTTQDLVDSAIQSIWGGSSEVLRDVIGRGLANVL